MLRDTSSLRTRRSYRKSLERTKAIVAGFEQIAWIVQLHVSTMQMVGNLGVRETARLGSSMSPLVQAAETSCIPAVSVRCCCDPSSPQHPEHHNRYTMQCRTRSQPAFQLFNFIFCKNLTATATAGRSFNPKHRGWIRRPASRHGLTHY
jgi:hypothetical protein